MRVLLLLIYLLQLAQSLSAQKKMMDADIYSQWKWIANRQISDDGSYVLYDIAADNSDIHTEIVDVRTNKHTFIQRTKNSKLTSDGSFAIMQQCPSIDSTKSFRRKKVKKDDLPQDTLLILNLKSNHRTILPKIKDYIVPEKWTDYIAYQFHPNKNDTTKLKKENDDNGYALHLRRLSTGQEYYFPYVTEYKFAKEAKVLIYRSSGNGDKEKAGIYKYDIVLAKVIQLYEGKARPEKILISNDGIHTAFIMNQDTTKLMPKPFTLMWAKDTMAAKIIVTSPIDNGSYLNSSDLNFDKESQRLYFGINPKPSIRDTSLLDEEIVNVEVWYTASPKLYTMQKSDFDKDANKSNDFVLDLQSKKIVSLNDGSFDRIVYSRNRKNQYAIGLVTKKTENLIQWQGYGYSDVYLIDIINGEHHFIASGINGNPTFSEHGKYVYWFDREKSKYIFYHINDKITYELKSFSKLRLTDELHDEPDFASSYGICGWTVNDEYVWIYDRYDIIEVKPNFPQEFTYKTQQRKNAIINRRIDLDLEENTIYKDRDILIHQHHEKSKQESYALLSPDGRLEVLLQGPYKFDPYPLKAKSANRMIITKQSFQEFPDLIVTDSSMATMRRVSDVNPQQHDYFWGSAEIHTWINEKGESLEGLLFKPENFDTKRKYPLIVNFYERNSDGLYLHRAPYAHRSQINYTYYLNKGYVIFNPDITYDTGYPGQSCYDDVISGTKSLIKKGFIDDSKMALQGHSWGGYQIAYLLTKTDMFRCAESGAPVVNMTSAYGGIRWESGMSRMFQYERSQSRIGKTLWEDQKLYIENSPLFTMDKVKTPVLILHNDKDGAVPWYQGIEYFTALRRLGKEAWLLNYNDEPHWPVKWQNRLDFQIRMEQFFDHFLMEKKKPLWMKQGIPAILKGIDSSLGY